MVHRKLKRKKEYDEESHWIGCGTIECLTERDRANEVFTYCNKSMKIQCEIVVCVRKEEVDEIAINSMVSCRI